MGIETRELADGFALEVRGVRLWEPPPAETVAALRALWAERGVLVFRRQALSEFELCAFSGYFGRLEPVVRSDWASPNFPDVGLMSNLRDASGEPIGGFGAGEVRWHSDHSYMARPATGALALAVELPARGGDTLFADLARAYDALPTYLWQAIDGRKGVFSYASRLAGYAAADRAVSAVRAAETPDVVHDLVQRNPVTGKASLYFDPTAVTGILGLPDDVVAGLLRELTTFCTRPEFVYRHRWEPGDVVMWDNAFLLHRRDPFDPGQRRLIKRVTLALSREFHIVPRGMPAELV
jgi:alpha-ketoglutarate-dependent taurine dioxygenase